MKKSRHTDEQIAFALRKAETDTPVTEAIRKIGISEQTFHNWKKRYVVRVGARLFKAFINCTI
jgi:putative transposase